LPRRQIVDAVQPGFYHCVSRCVRRAFLCGEDRYTGLNFDHRKRWIEKRLRELADCFAISVYAFAIMDNHLHLVVHVDSQAVLHWSAEEVGRRWASLFPVRKGGEVDRQACETRARTIADDPARCAIVRERLASLSWFMRCLCEPIARRANREDGCTGRFWEGRYKCQALLDDHAVLACMAYVDLNPVRAGLAKSVASSRHTSARRRLASGESRHRAGARLLPVFGSSNSDVVAICARDYLALVEWTGRSIRFKGRADPTGPPFVRTTHGVITAERWVPCVRGIETRYWRAVGAVEALLDKAAKMGQSWLKGVGTARDLARAHRAN
jgi:REP element-mobilizing transposase RayT